ncbi:lipoate--protein ligase family protein [Carnobacteriaceae bacterium zg-C25]|nr:lipoate--protein ligase family protein [Carnobacteriaceae bacterium zg-C25]
MDTITNVLKRTPIVVFDESDRASEQLYQPFAWGDVFLRAVNKNPDSSILHIWPMENTLILGMLDRRLPYCDDAIKTVRTNGYRAIVRNVGGLAVVADEGILNFSFILPKRPDEKLSIQDAYIFMYDFICEMFSSYRKKIEHFTIEDSYCPGDFDLSINGKKFAGTAQRRFKDGVSISIYLSVCGNQQKRGELVRAFYQEGKKNEPTNYAFPDVNPSAMMNLEDLLGVKLTVDDVKTRLMETLKRFNDNVSSLDVTPELKKQYREFHDKMIERNRNA